MIFSKFTRDISNVLLLLSLMPLTGFSATSETYLSPGYEFSEVVDSKYLKAECDAEKGDERGPFGITYQSKTVSHLFLVMTGVPYETCRELESRAGKLLRGHKKLILKGVGADIFEKNEVTWRWQSLRTVDGKKCLSYFVGDCPPGR